MKCVKEVSRLRVIKWLSKLTTTRSREGNPNRMREGTKQPEFKDAWIEMKGTLKMFGTKEEEEDSS